MCLVFLSHIRPEIVEAIAEINYQEAKTKNTPFKLEIMQIELFIFAGCPEKKGTCEM